MFVVRAPRDGEAKGTQLGQEKFGSDFWAEQPTLRRTTRTRNGDNTMSVDGSPGGPRGAAYLESSFRRCRLKVSEGTWVRPQGIGKHAHTVRVDARHRPLSRFRHSNLRRDRGGAGKL